MSPAQLAPDPSQTESEPAKPEPAKAEPAAAPVPKAPEQIARQKYWYFDYTKTQGNAIVDEVYRDSQYLHPEWVAKVEPGFDMFLCAQNIADEVIVGPADIVGSNAALMAYHGPWDGAKVWSEIEVYLTMYGDQWRINRIVCRR